MIQSLKGFKGYLLLAGISLLLMLIITAAAVGTAGISLQQAFFVLVKNIPIVNVFIPNRCIDETAQLIITLLKYGSLESFCHSLLEWGYRW